MLFVVRIKVKLVVSSKQKRCNRTLSCKAAKINETVSIVFIPPEKSQGSHKIVPKVYSAFLLGKLLNKLHNSLRDNEHADEQQNLFYL